MIVKKYPLHKLLYNVRILSDELKKKKKNTNTI